MENMTAKHDKNDDDGGGGDGDGVVCVCDAASITI